MTPNKYLQKLLKYENIESITAIWAEVNGLIKELDEVKKLCRTKVQQHLEETGEAKGKTQTCSYGWTNPKPKLQLNEKAWQNEVLENPNVREIVQLFQHQEMRLKRAQEPFYEEIIPHPRVYIK